MDTCLYRSSNYSPPSSQVHLFPTPSTVPASPAMESSVAAVEKILGYVFTNKKLLEEALTHSSASETVSYQRLEFVGDAALGLAVSNYLYLLYPMLDPGNLSLIRSGNISTEKLARVAINHGIYPYVRRHSVALDRKVAEFAKTVTAEDHPSVYGKITKAPKILADIVEALAAAVYIDTNFDLQKLWEIFRALLEPIITYGDLEKQPQPVTLLYEWCQKQGKKVDIQFGKTGTTTVASVYVDGELVSTASSEQRDIAKLEAANEALSKLTDTIPTNLRMMDIFEGLGSSFDIEGAKQKLHEICGKKRWAKPTYKVERQEGPSHDRKFVCSVEVSTGEGILRMVGDEKPKVKESDNSAASLMIRALQNSSYLGF